MSYYLHHIPGRLRVKTPIIKNNEFAAQRIRRLLESEDGIETLDVNLTTGSLLINYDASKTKRSRIIQKLKEKGYFDETKAITNHQYFHNAGVQLFQLLSVFI